MNFDYNLRQTEYYLDIAEAALHDLSNARAVTSAEMVVLKSCEDALIAHLQAEKADVRRSRAMLAQANLDGDPELIRLVTDHVNRKVTDYNALYASVRAELVELMKTRINAHADIALQQQLFDAACDAVDEAASQL